MKEFWEAFRKGLHDARKALGVTLLMFAAGFSLALGIHDYQRMGRAVVGITLTVTFLYLEVSDASAGE